MNRIFTEEQVDKVFGSDFYKNTQMAKPITNYTLDQIEELYYSYFLFNIRNEMV